DFEGRQAQRSSGRTARHVRACHQCQDRMGPWPDDPAVALGTGGSGDRVVDRRLFVTRLSLALLVAPSLGTAQGRRKPTRVGVLWVATEQASAPLIQPFVERLTALGYAQGRDVVLEQRWARGRYDDLPRLAAELVRGEVDVLIGPANAIVVAEKHATTRIPI